MKMRQKTAGRKVPRLFVQYRLVGPNAGYSFSFVSCRHFLQPFRIRAANWNASIHQCCFGFLHLNTSCQAADPCGSGVSSLKTGLRVSATYSFTFYEVLLVRRLCCVALCKPTVFLASVCYRTVCISSYCVLFVPDCVLVLESLLCVLRLLCACLSRFCEVLFLGGFNIQAWAGTFEPVKSDLSQLAPNRFLALHADAIRYRHQQGQFLPGVHVMAGADCGPPL